MISKNLQAVLVYLHTVENINDGGCGISALATFRWIKKNEPKMLDGLKLVGLYKSKRCRDHNMRVLKERYGTMEVAWHFCLLVDDLYIDSGGDVEISDYKFLQHIDLDEIEGFLDNVINHNLEDWCWEFSRNLHVEDIAERLEIDLSDIELMI